MLTCLMVRESETLTLFTLVVMSTIPRINPPYNIIICIFPIATHSEFRIAKRLELSFAILRKIYATVVLRIHHCRILKDGTRSEETFRLFSLFQAFDLRPQDSFETQDSVNARPTFFQDFCCLLSLIVGLS